MRKLIVMLLAVAALLAAPAILGQAARAEGVWLDYTTIIAQDRIYYSGSLDGGERGLYVMNTDGSGARRIADFTPSLLALSGENLLVYMEDYEGGDPFVAVIWPDGSMRKIPGVEGSGRALAAEGRFFFECGSCAQDGGDVQIYFDLTSSSYYDYYPLAVEGGYFYYLDRSDNAGLPYNEGSNVPIGAALCRMNLIDRTREVISGVGSAFLGIEDGFIYYTRSNFWNLTEDSSTEVVVDEGLFRAELSSLEETRLASYPAGDQVVDVYEFVRDGVVYGMHSDFGQNSYHIIRLAADGTAMEPIVVENGEWVTISCLSDNVLYACAAFVRSSEDDFIQEDRVIAIDLISGVQTILNPTSIDALFYTESNPAVQVAYGRLYYSAYDMERWSTCLKSMNLDGSDLRLLAHGISAAEG